MKKKLNPQGPRSFERRKHTRMKTNIAVKLCRDEWGDIVAETENISRAGALCRINRYIDPMTKLKIHILLPFKRNGNNKSKAICCEGIVVRSEPALKNGYYSIAIFFSEIAQRDAETIEEYVSAHTEAK